MNEAFSANIDKNNLNVESATIHYLSGKHLYSAAGTTGYMGKGCLLYTSPSPRDRTRYRMPSSA